MSVALYEFPLCEKVRNYLRLEQLFSQLRESKAAKSEHQYLHFLKLLFDTMDLIDRLDLRTDFLRDIDAQEKKLVYWSQHPDINTQALEQALKTLSKLSAEIKKNTKLGASLKNERFLQAIKQRFTIPSGATCFDLPALFCWLKQDDEIKQEDTTNWLDQLKLIENALEMLLAFLREKAPFQEVETTNGFYQGSSEDKLDLIRVRMSETPNVYPVLSGSKSRYGIRFMQLNSEDASEALTSLRFDIACC